MRYNVTFSTSYPIDLDAHPPGEELAMWLSEQLQAAGIPYESVDNSNDYAWSIDSPHKNDRAWLLLGFVDDGDFSWLLQVQSGVSFLGRLLGYGDTPQCDHLAQAIHRVLSSDHRFSSIQWHAGDFAEGTPAAKPDEIAP